MCPESSPGVWLTGSLSELPDVEYKYELARINCGLERTIRVGHVLEMRGTDGVEWPSPPNAVIVEGRLMRHAEDLSGVANADVAPLVPWLLKRAGIEVPVLYVAREDIDCSRYTDFGYAAIVEPNPDVDARVAVAVRTLRTLL